MKIRILGSGTSTECPRLDALVRFALQKIREIIVFVTSALVQTGDATLLLDCGPDFRVQMLHVPFGKIDAVLISHEHYDHVEVWTTYVLSVVSRGTYLCRNVYGMSVCVAGCTYACGTLFIREFRYIPLREIEPNRPFLVNHTKCYLEGNARQTAPFWVIGSESSDIITDMLTNADESFEQLQGVDVLVMNALRVAPHKPHQSLSEADGGCGIALGQRKPGLFNMDHHIRTSGRCGKTTSSACAFCIRRA